MSTRKFSDLQSRVGASVANAVEIIERLGGRRTHDSGHAKSPTWIYSFRAQQEAQVALRINQDKLSIYVRATPHGRHDFEPALGQWAKVEQSYPNPDEKPVSSLRSDNHAAFLTPKRGKLLRLRVKDDQLEPLLKSYLPTRLSQGPSPVSTVAISAESEVMPISAQPEAGGASEPVDEQSSERPGSNSAQRVTTPEQLKQALDRNDVTGRAGEMLVYEDELTRLEAGGCPDPVAHVKLVANENVAAGYDICSEWGGERRCIEVKTTASGREQFFMSVNECDTLRAMGTEAWLYRVDLSAGDGGAVVMRLQDPMAKLGPDRFRPAVWEVDVRNLRDRHE